MPENNEKKEEIKDDITEVEKLEKKGIKINLCEPCTMCNQIISMSKMKQHFKSKDCYNFDESMKIIHDHIEKIKKCSKFHPHIEFNVSFDR
jgi:hypothetical protein